MTLIVTSNYQLNRVTAPRLPAAPVEYEARYQNQFADILRLYFNRLDNILGQLVATMDTLPVQITGTNLDAFGRMRVSNPLTLFDSSHRYSDNNLWASSITGTAAATFSANEGLVNLTVGTASGDQIIRETIKVFSGVCLVAVAYLYVQNDDYHKKFDKQISFEYNCKTVLEGRVSVPQFVIDECNDGRRIVIVKAYQE